MTTVSVAMATYSGAAHLGEQLRSILAQTVPVQELVVADDGSTDGTVDLIRRIWSESSALPTLQILPSVPERLGVARNFERALAATTGDVVLLSDQDDVWAVDRVARSLAEFSCRPELDLLFSDARLIDEDGRPLGAGLFDTLPIRAEEKAMLAGPEAFSALLRRNLATGATMAVRRAALEGALPVGDGWLHDEWLAAWTALTSTVAMLPEQLIDYRQHGRNVIGVTKPTLRHRIHRVLEPRGDRNATLARRMTALEDRARERIDIHADRLAEIRAKRQFELARASLPAIRPARIPQIVRLAVAGGYGKYASQGHLDIVRDLFQPV